MQSILVWLLCALPLSVLAQPAPSPQRLVDVAVVKTPFGSIAIYLYKDTPNHRQNFIQLAREGFYDSTTFHRVIKNFMVQGGDPNSRDANPSNDGQGSNGYTQPAEIRPQYVHKRGAVAAARLGDQMNPKRESSGCQFYIVHGGNPIPRAQLQQMQGQAQQALFMQFATQTFPTLPEGRWVKDLTPEVLQALSQDSVQKLNERYSQQALESFARNSRQFAYTEDQLRSMETQGGAPHLDMQYTVFGEVLQGMEVVDQIAAQQVAPPDRPVNDIKMTVSLQTMTWAEMAQRFGTPSVE